ncbi:unnamed protein product [Hymenolepis diminuta]|uniref:Peptidase A2 domain-containing protein n=1 Tax=Hymenolepis diminuta TaxID=6216 RepID=A0A564YTE2_HYMDI|nr:unnamed protein product [Hymenolepis diminuta]
MKLLAPGESFDTDFWKILYFKKLPSYIQPILVNGLKTEPVESLADMADNIIETVGPPRIEEIPHTSHLTPTKIKLPAAWEERLLKLEAKIDALTLQRTQLRSRPFNRRRRSQSRHAPKSRRCENKGNNICWYHCTYGSFGKRVSPAVVAETVSGHSSNRLFLQDRNSGTSYLIDSGAEISVLPSTPTNRSFSNHPLILAAANDSPIKTYGQKSVTLDLGLRRTFRWIFTIADVSKPIIGANFLCHFELLLDHRRKKLLDPLTSLHSKCSEYPCSTYSPITCIQSSESPFYSILKKFQDLINPVCCDKPVNHSVIHFIITYGNPVKARVRRLSPTRYKSARDEFEHMLDLGII